MGAPRGGVGKSVRKKVGRLDGLDVRSVSVSRIETRYGAVTGPAGCRLWRLILTLKNSSAS